MSSDLERETFEATSEFSMRFRPTRLLISVDAATQLASREPRDSCLLVAMRFRHAVRGEWEAVAALQSGPPGSADHHSLALPALAEEMAEMGHYSYYYHYDYD